MDRKPVPWWFSVFTAAAALFLIFQPSAAKQVEDWGSQLLAPVSSQASGAADSVTEVWRTVESIGTLRRTNIEQGQEIDRLKFQVARMEELEVENEDLRRLLEFKRNRPDLLLQPVRVLGTDSTGIVDVVMVDKGSTDGIREDMAVITWRGLAGRVVHVYPTSAAILLVTDVNSSVAARVMDTSSRASGIVGGRKEGGLLMRHILQQELVQTGDLVVTSGVGGSLPSGIPIGTVLRVQKRNIEMFQEAVVEPAVDTDKLERLYAVLDYPKN